MIRIEWPGSGNKNGPTDESKGTGSLIMLNRATTEVSEWLLVKYVETFSSLVFLIKPSCPFQVYGIDKRMFMVSED